MRILTNDAAIVLLRGDMHAAHPIRRTAGARERVQSHLRLEIRPRFVVGCICSLCQILFV
jgi:hypothetical protein